MAKSKKETYEKIRDRLEAVVEKLEHKEVTLEESLKLYEEGVGLVGKAHSMLDDAERRLEVLKPNAESGFELEDQTKKYQEDAE